MGVLIALLATAVRVSELSGHMTHKLALWNAAGSFGMYLVFVVLLDHLRAAHAGQPERAAGPGRTRAPVTVLRALVAAVVLVAMSAGVGAIWDKRVLGAAPVGARATSGTRAAATTGAAANADGDSAAQADAAAPTVARLETVVAAALKRSRLDLLGSRDPNLNSCVTPVLSGQLTDKLPSTLGDYDGGPGTKLAVMLALDRQVCARPMQDFEYHQGRLRRYLENALASNADSLQLAETAERTARAMADRLAAAKSFPSDLAPSHFADRTTWPDYCLASLDAAIAARDLPGARRWADELSGATFSLADLHRWLAFLTHNYLDSLDFQAMCKTVFEGAESNGEPYDRNSTLSQLPAGLMTLHGGSNFYEVEHRAERLFSMPADRLATLGETSDAPGPRCLPPVERTVYRRVWEALSPANRRSLDAAAQSPFDHTYVTNMLDRADKSSTVDQLVQCMREFNARNDHADPGELLGMLMYRGHSFAAIEWSDRFLPQLMTAAKTFAPQTDEQALVSAAQWTNDFYRQPATYGVTFSLRDALAEKRLDCVRATDMIGALFRDSGHARFGHIRWTCETGGHSVAAAFIPTPEGGHKTLIMDGLNPTRQPEIWPDAYFHGHVWPAGMEKFPTPYAAELYVRGLDNYVWAEGYILRGPNAGNLMKAKVPYLKDRATPETVKVFEGPYPLP